MGTSLGKHQTALSLGHDKEKVGTSFQTLKNNQVKDGRSTEQP
jgi:hypothetical protein